MVSIIITTKDDSQVFEKSFNALIESISNFDEDQAEIIVATPNEYEFLINFSKIPLIFVKDENKGKPNAINKAIQAAHGEYIVFSDGDVLIDKLAIKNLYSYLIKNNLNIAGGKPISLERKNYMLGYWSHVLVEGNASRIRKNYEEKRLKGEHKFFPVSGYLFIIKKDIYKNIDNDILADDAYISYTAFQKGHNIGYCENALVFVKYPKTYSDYLAQKIRSAGGYTQRHLKTSKSRSFLREALEGTLATILFANNLKELFWSILLLASRIHVWLIIFIKLKVHKDFNVWKVIKTSKNI